jgi:ubiquinone/menaquinone biosynthesis C-methylase UbiE
VTAAGREAGGAETDPARSAPRSPVPFDAVALGYDRAMARVSEPFIPDLLAACALGRGERLLDLGTGTGLVAAAAARTPCTAARVVGLDVSPAMLARARERVAPFRVALVTGDAEALPCRDGSFDAAAGHFVLVFLKRPAAAVAELHRVLRPGGRVVLTALSRPEATAYGPVLEALGRRAPRARELLDRLCSLGTPDRLARLLTAAGFREAGVEAVRREVRWASFGEYWSVIETGGGLAGQEYRALPDAARGAVEAEVRRAVALRRDAGGLAWDVEVLLGTARR